MKKKIFFLLIYRDHANVHVSAGKKINISLNIQSESGFNGFKNRTLNVTIIQSMNAFECQHDQIFKLFIRFKIS